jgi:FtsH-binding integral membrane protein
MGMGFQRMNYTTLVVVFGIYSVLMGMSLSFLILIYTSASIFKTFLITSLMFGFMAFLGYTTKTDLTKMGSILMMALFGLIIASLVNFFMKSAAFDYFISFIGVIIFTGLTAYDVQKLKRIGSGVEYQGAEMAKLTILGALTLYLDFINLFLFLLRLFGDRK